MKRSIPITSLAFVFVVSSCAVEPGYVSYYKHGMTTPQLERDFFSCGGTNLFGKMTYSEGNLPAIDKCMRAKGYKASTAPKVKWTKEGTTPEDHRRDYKQCGVLFNIFTDRATVKSGTLPEVDKCLREKGYKVDKVD